MIDLRTSFSRFNYGGTQPKEEYEVTLATMLAQWDKFLNGKEFLNGKLSYIDFMFWELIDMLSLVFPGKAYSFQRNQTLSIQKQYSRRMRIFWHITNDLPNCQKSMPILSLTNSKSPQSVAQLHVMVVMVLSNEPKNFIKMMQSEKKSDLIFQSC